MLENTNPYVKLACLKKFELSLKEEACNTGNTENYDRFINTIRNNILQIEGQIDSIQESEHPLLSDIFRLEE